MNSLLLVVDDDKDMLELVAKYLAREDYKVVQVDNAEAALETFETLPRQPDLVLVDVVMPGMSGPMLAERLRALAPGLRVLFMSAYDHTQVVQRYVVDRGFQLLPKPFNSKSLHKAIKTALQNEVPVH